MIRIPDLSIRKVLEYRSTCYYDPDPTDGGDCGGGGGGASLMLSNVAYEYELTQGVVEKTPDNTD